MLRTERAGGFKFIKLMVDREGFLPQEIVISVDHIVSLEKIHHDAGDMIARPQTEDQAAKLLHTFKVYMANGQTFLGKVATEGGQRLLHEMFDQAV